MEVKVYTRVESGLFYLITDLTHAAEVFVYATLENLLTVRCSHSLRSLIIRGYWCDSSLDFYLLVNVENVCDPVSGHARVSITHLSLIVVKLLD